MSRMRDGVQKRGSRWAFVVDLGYQPARRCAAGCRGVRVWADDDLVRCRRCAGPLADPVPERRQRWASGYRTRKEALAARREALRVASGGGDPFPAEITVREFVEEKWLPHLEAMGNPRPSTRDGYELLLKAHILPVIGEVRVDRVKPGHIQPALDAMQAKGRKPRTIAHARAAISSAFTAAMRWGLVDVNPVRATQAPTPEPPDLRWPTVEELRTIARAAEGTAWEIPVLLATTTGARRGEILGLRWSRVDLDRGTVRIEEGLQRLRTGELVFAAPKTKHALRTVPIPGWATDRLRRWKTEQTRRRLALGDEWNNLDLVCERGDGTPIDPPALSQAFTRLVASIGLRGVRLHDCRHGVATALAKHGARPEVVSRILGHSSVAFTQSVYTHPDDEQIEEAIRNVENALGSSSDG